MKKKVWIFNHHANGMFFDNAGRHYSFAKYLKEKGYESAIFCSNAQHGTGKVFFDNDDPWHIHMNESTNIPYVFIKGRPYIGNGKDRILCMLDYYKNVKIAAEKYAEQNGIPDIIIGSQVHPLAVLVAEQLAKKYKCKCIAEFRDLWPESIVAIGLAKKTSPIIVAMRMLEKRLYKKADAIIFTLEGGYEYIIERHWDSVIPKSKVHYINNGVDLKDYDKNVEKNAINDPLLEDDQHFNVIYAGTIRRANGLEELIDSAIALRDNENIHFLIYGDGDQLDELKTKVEKNKLNNVFFRGRIPRNCVPYVLSRGNLNLLNYNAVAAAAGFYRFGASQNKLFEYFASGKPILANFKTGHDLIEKYNCGISKEILNADEYAKNLLDIVNLSHEEYESLCRNSRDTAEKYDYKKLTDILIGIIESL